ncbi:MAG: GGDEF domain-containing protein [Rhodoferax sp.]|jgi:diguanylate cyclase (GGDEF)-like protein
MKPADVHADRVPSLLANSRLFKGVDLATMDAELRESRLLSIDPGQVLLDPKHLNTHIYIVLHGELLVCLEPKITNPLVRLGVGDCVGELSIIDASAPSAYVVAAVQTQLLSITKPVLWRMLALQQTMALNLLHVLAHRIRENNVVLLGSLELQRQYRNKAETDALTGLHNRAWFEEVFPKQLELCERTGQHASLLMVDIDHFKKVNDEYGHSCGDEVLRHMGSLLRRNLRSTDLCARYGGEEMIVLMPGTEMLQGQLTADRLRESIANTPLRLQDGRELTVQVSGGIAQWQPGTALHDLIRSADQALYKAKDGGRNQIATSTLPNHFEVS